MVLALLGAGLLAPLVLTSDRQAALAAFAAVTVLAAPLAAVVATSALGTA